MMKYEQLAREYGEACQRNLQKDEEIERLREENVRLRSDIALQCKQQPAEIALQCKQEMKMFDECDHGSYNPDQHDYCPDCGVDGLFIEHDRRAEIARLREENGRLRAEIERNERVRAEIELWRETRAKVEGK